MGAVAYDPKVVTIWEGFRSWFRRRGFEFDFVLYSHYERQVDDLLDGRIHVAWNSPLAWVRARRVAAQRRERVEALAMRDTDQDLSSLVIVRSDSVFEDLSQLAGATVGTGAVDSPQGTLLPIQCLREGGLEPGDDIAVRRFDVGVGLHGDHVGGEREAAAALLAGEVDAACLIDTNLLAFGREGTLPAGSVRVIAQTPLYDHCNMTAGPARHERTAEFVDLLLSMDYGDDEARVLMDLEGLTAWRPGRTDGYGQLEAAVDAAHFYDEDGAITARDYRP
jgi:phosphonate transport system substrate-binding protein